MVFLSSIQVGYQVVLPRRENIPLEQQSQITGLEFQVDITISSRG